MLKKTRINIVPPFTSTRDISGTERATDLRIARLEAHGSWLVSIFRFSEAIEQGNAFKFAFEKKNCKYFENSQLFNFER